MAGDRSPGSGLWRTTAAAVVLLCAASFARAQGEEPSRVGDVGQAIVALLIFAGVLFVLGRFAWKPVIAQLKRREREIEERIRDTERRQREAQQLEAGYRARLDRAEAEAKQILAKTLNEATKAREEVLAAARDQGNKAIEAARAEIEQFKQGALEDLQQAMAELAVNIAGQILRQELSPQKQQELVDQSLERIRSRAARDSA